MMNRFKKKVLRVSVFFLPFTFLLKFVESLLCVSIFGFDHYHPC